ncbi:hypothetical protein F511_23147 [Dorcoceras hygrometricum]|uniref:Uncharacterized protein n=1 Tax=Dorcoceras hygrometricum TaxID=472368 RepID=A0A2Z7C1L2_9LAMI|nr:hypothetical protein F511_23147 [Dorcoceras hygrometricum]
MYAVNLFMEVRSSISYISPSSAIGKDPLEGFDYSDPRCNPLLRPAAARTPSNTTAHQHTSCMCLTHFFYTSFELKLLLVDIARSVRLNEEVTRVSQHFGVLTIISADDYLDSADTLVKERSADDYLDSADTLVKERSADDYLDSADTLVKERSADDYLDSADTLVKERSADDYLDSADTLVKERSADGLRAADRYDGVGVTFVAGALRPCDLRLSGICLQAVRITVLCRGCESNAIVGVVTTGFECLPPSCDGLTGPDDHGPMISRLIDRGVSGNQAGPSGSSVGRSPHP